MLSSIVLGLAAIAGIVALEWKALGQGINGQQLRWSCIFIALIGGAVAGDALNLMGG